MTYPVEVHGRTPDNSTGSPLVVRIRKLLDKLAGGLLRTDAGPADGIEAVNLAGDTNYAAGQEPRSIYVGTGGDVKVDGYDRTGTAVTGVVFKNAPAGQPLPLSKVSKIYSSGTTAADLVSLW